MKTIITLIITAIIGICIFIGCSTVGVGILSTIQSAPEEGWSHTAYLEKLMNHPKKQLLTKIEKIKVAKGICALKHLDKRQNNKTQIKLAKVFCKLEKNDNIYFYDWCKGCTDSKNGVGTSYLLVRDGKSFEAVQIEQRRDRELQQSFPILERLH